MTLRRSATSIDFPVTPDDDDGPVTVTIDYTILYDDREQFRVLMQEVQATCRRNGAFQCRLDESLDQPGMFRLEYIVSTWAEHLRQNMRMTIDETEVFEKVWELHVGDTETDDATFPLNREVHAPARLRLFWSDFHEYVENAKAQTGGGCLRCITREPAAESCIDCVL